MKNLPGDAPGVSNQDRRNQAIRCEFERQKSRGVRSAYIITELAYRYYLAESTVTAIVWHKGRYKAVSQPTRELVAA